MKRIAAMLLTLVLILGVGMASADEDILRVVEKT